jgi:hypothetical protein
MKNNGCVFDQLQFYLALQSATDNSYCRIGAIMFYYSLVNNLEK